MPNKISISSLKHDSRELIILAYTVLFGGFNALVDLYLADNYKKISGYSPTYSIFPLGNGELIDRATQHGTLFPNKTWESHTYNGLAATIIYKIRVICDPNYYGNRCTKFCQPRNDSFGHYTCNESGNKDCLPGWRGKLCDIGWLKVD